MKTIGLLWDSLSDNMGDRAIGLLVQRALEAQHIPFRVVSPYETKVSDIAMLIIGGGELIRAPGSPFYDVFRVPGRHILNTVGAVNPGAHSAYLQDYRFVTVRSQGDRDALGVGEVTPCLTLLYRDYLPPVTLPVDIPDGAIGIHVHHGSLTRAWEFMRWLKQNGQRLGPIVFLPVTHYNADVELMNVMASRMPDARVLPIMGPDQVFAAISRMRFLVSSSLHAVFFAYMQDVPFIAWRSSNKIRMFLDERGLGDRGFQDFPEVGEKLLAYTGVAPSPALHERDQARCRDALAQIIAHSREALSEGDTPPITLNAVQPEQHALEIAGFRRTGEQVAGTHAVYFDAIERSLAQRDSDVLTPLGFARAVRRVSRRRT